MLHRVFLILLRAYRPWAWLALAAGVACSLLGPTVPAWILAAAALPLLALLGAVEPVLVVLVASLAGLLHPAGLAAAMTLSTLVALARLRGHRAKDPRPTAALGTLAIVSTLLALPFFGYRVLLPAAFALLLAPLGMDILLPRRERGGNPRLPELLGGFYAFFYVIGLQFLLLVVLLKLLRLPVRPARWLGSRGMAGLFRTFPYGRYERSGLTREVFKKPAIVVSNHQSSVDIPLMLSLPGDVRLTTSKRVWSEPWFGFSARALGHVRVDEDLLETCRKTLAEGACVHFFPEGTRSQDGYPARFHRGAFELATELGCDIIPLVICDTRTCVPRDAYWVHNFHMVVRALPRVAPGDDSRALQLSVQAMVREAFAAELKRLNTKETLRKKVLRLYRYQGWRVMLAVRRELSGLEVPEEPIERIENCGYGAKAHWVSECFPNVRVTATDPDARKIAVARRTTGMKPRLRFETGTG